ncbi:hypothetical protein A0128_06090 [Leptospira tipperaryensis]|uniref:Uncharacterized protein n=1 Tax=Leptospira tipperaryensis TaxID=2564040 RepID=A0A1D7UV95_9LEPT|nr:hypothetical protein A0128_06090 [Leptospira tipperaryensis]
MCIGLMIRTPSNSSGSEITRVIAKLLSKKEKTKAKSAKFRAVKPLIVKRREKNLRKSFF